jgi:protein-tyrosine kinase
MSIIERALDKLRDNPRPATPPPRAKGAPDASSRRAAAPHLAAATARGIEFHPAKQCRIDLQRLRDQGVLPQDDAEHRIRNEFRRVKWPLLASASGKEGDPVPRGNLIMIASALAGEGKTFVTVNLAMSLSQEKDCRVLVVDADLAKPRLTHLFGLQNEPGLTELLADEHGDVANAVLATEIDNLFVLPTGRQASNAPELLASKRMQQVAEQLISASGELVVLFDSSPLLLTNESHVLSTVVGQVLLVVRAGVTTHEMVQEAITHIDKARQISCVLNQTSNANTSDYYYYYDNSGQSTESGTA